MRALRSLAVLLIVAPVCLAEDLRTLGGKTLSGSVTSITDSEITIKTDKETVSTPLSQVLALDLRPAKEPTGTYSSVRLLDDTALVCSQVNFAGSDVQLTLLSGTTLKVPLSAVVSVVHEAQNQALRKRFEEFTAKRVNKDRIVILRDGELNPIEGTLGEVDAKKGTIVFKRDGAKDLDLPLKGLHGLIFHRLEVPAEIPVCRVIDLVGNNLSAVKLGYDGKDTYNITTTFGAKLSLKADVLSTLDFNLGKLTFLSDLEPARVVEKSGVGLITRYRKDSNLDGQPILLEKQHGKGLSMHAHTELEYNLAGKYKEFKAILGVDARTGADSQALVTIYCDGDKRFSELATPKKSRPVSINVKDVGTLKIVVSSRNFLDLHDHATLADARVSQ
jgi:hypothetical protein